LTPFKSKDLIERKTAVPAHSCYRIAENGDIEGLFSDDWKWLAFAVEAEMLAVVSPLRSATATSITFLAICDLRGFPPTNLAGIPTYTRHIELSFPFISFTYTL